MTNRTLYVSRPLVNAADIIDWAKGQGFGTTLSPDDLHVTIAYSKEAFDRGDLKPLDGEVIAAAGTRAVKSFGDGSVTVLTFESDELSRRWQEFRDAGASWDWPEYAPHVTITYEAGDIDPGAVEPYAGPIHLGPERFAEIDDDWSSKVTEKFTRSLMMPDLQMFIPITKVDAANRLVYGIATAEQKDRSGEICDYELTKPYYEKWSGEVEKASDGKSLGNLRAMHGKVAAGKVTSINFNDSDKQIEICAKVIDDAEWNKVEEGVYTGFSQGGSYVRKWKDVDGLQRYTAGPTEVSLVDIPALPSATFQMIKADGMVEEKSFKPAEEPDLRAEVEQVWKSKDGQTFKTKADAVKHAADLAKVNSAAKPLDDATAALAAALGKAADGTDDRAALVTALNAYEADAGKHLAKRHLIKRAKALNATDVLPAGWIEKAAPVEMDKLATAELKKQATLYSISNLISLLASLECAEEQLEGAPTDPYAYYNNANTKIDVSKDTTDRFGSLLVEFGDIVATLLDEILSSMSAEENAELVAKAAPFVDLAKAGARHSKGDKANLQKAHDALVALGADCGTDAEKLATGDLAKAGDLAKVIADNADMKAAMEKAIGMMADAGKTIVDLKAEVELLKAQPMPGGAVQLQVVGKEDEGMAEIRKLAESNDPDAIAEALIKRSFGRPMHSLPGHVSRTAPAEPQK